MGDRIAVMKDGVVQQVADPIQLYNHPANLFVGGFIGTPPMNFFRGTLRGEAGGLCFVEETQPNAAGKSGFRLKLTPEHSAKLGANAGKSMTLGLRPEDIALSPGGDGAKPDSALDAVVELVEPLGAETFFHLTTGIHPFIARLRAAERVAPNRSVSAVFNLSRCHFFDPATGTAVI